MEPGRNRFVFWLLGAIVILVSFAILSYSGSGEILSSTNGVVQKCEVLGEKTAGSLVHATIEVDGGGFIIAELYGCTPGRNVTILVRRGALYFNTVFTAEPA